MASVWPVSLPQSPQIGVTEQFPHSLITTTFETGPPKARRRSTSTKRPFNVSLTMTSAQLDTLRTFFVTTLDHGANEFQWVIPNTSTDAVFRFLNPPIARGMGGDYWAVSFEMLYVRDA